MNNLLKWIISVTLFAVANTTLADRVFLQNGDIITGEIKQIRSGELIIHPTYAGDITIDLGGIDYLVSNKPYSLKFTDGSEVESQLSGKDPSGNQILILSDGTTRAIPFAKLAELAKVAMKSEQEEPEDTFDWDSEVSAKGKIDKGNTDSENLTIKLATKLEMEKHRHFLNIRFAREEQEGIDTKEQDNVDYNYNWSFKKPWFLGMSGAYERDPIKDLTYRYNFSPGLGYEIWNDSLRFFTVELTAGYLQEKIAGDENNSATAGWKVRLTHDLMDGNLKFFHNHTLNSNLGGRSNTVINSTTGLKYKLIEDLNMNVELEFDRESNPSGDADKEDITLLFGVGYEF